MRERANRRGMFVLLLGLLVVVGATAAAGLPTHRPRDTRNDSSPGARRDAGAVTGEPRAALRAQARRDALKSLRASQQAANGEENRRNFEQPHGEVRWILTRRGSVEGLCLDVAGEEIHGPDRGGAGSCGATTDNGAFTWAIGGIDVGGRWFNVVYGEVLREAAGLRVTLGDGTERTDRDFGRAGGMWILVIPAVDAMDSAADVTAIEAVDESGAVIAREEPPSMVDYRRAASSSGSPE